MSEMTNKTIAVVANEKNEMHKSIFDDELFDDVSSYDSDELLCGMGIPMEFSFYKDRGCIKKGDSIRIDDCKMSEVTTELDSLFSKLSCHNTANDFDLSADALVYEISDSINGEMIQEQLVASVVPEDDAQKRCFFEKILDAPKDKEYAVLAFDWKEQRIVFYGIYKLCATESCMKQRVVMKLTDDTYTPSIYLINDELKVYGDATFGQRFLEFFYEQNKHLLKDNLPFCDQLNDMLKQFFGTSTSWYGVKNKDPKHYNVIDKDNDLSAMFGNFGAGQNLAKLIKGLNTNSPDWFRFEKL